MKTLKLSGKMRVAQSNFEAFQDGAQFYDSLNGRLIADYAYMVIDDQDVRGATIARAQFLTDHSDYKMEQDIVL